MDPSPDPPDTMAVVRLDAASLARALRRDLRGPAVALVLSWSGIVVLLDAAVIGAILGVLVAAGAISTAATIRWMSGLGTTGGVSLWHLLHGALAGAGAGALWAGRALFGTPWGVAVSLAIGLLGGLAISVAGVWGEDEVLRLRRRRRPSRDEIRRLAKALQRAGTGLNAPGSPSFAMVDSEVPLARAQVRHVVVSTGLLDAVDDEELAAILVHADHHRRAGDVLRRGLLFGCGWPVMVLGGLGRDQAGRAQPGLWAGLLRLVTWPAWVSVRLVLDPVLEGTCHRAEYEADAAARRAGLGQAMVWALWAVPGFEGSGRLASLLGPAGPPRALRVDKLQTTRPLDAFFRDPAPEGHDWATRRRWALAGAAATLSVLALGAAMGAPGTGSARQQALQTASSFTTSYLDTAFDPAATRRLVTSSVPAPSVHRADGAAAVSPLTLTAELAGGEARASGAAALGCRYVPGAVGAGSGQHAASVVVLASWRFDIGGRARDQLVTGTVPLARSHGRWRPTNVPELSLDHGARRLSSPSSPWGTCG